MTAAALSTRRSPVESTNTKRLLHFTTSFRSRSRAVNAQVLILRHGALNVSAEGPFGEKARELCNYVATQRTFTKWNKVNCAQMTKDGAAAAPLIVNARSEHLSRCAAILSRLLVC